MSRSQQARQRHKQRKAKIAKKEDRADANLAKKLLTSSKDNCLNCMFCERSNFTYDEKEYRAIYEFGNTGNYYDTYHGRGCTYKMRVMKEKKKYMVELPEEKICGFHKKKEVNRGY